jgi:hypothetical protein
MNEPEPIRPIEDKPCRVKYLEDYIESQADPEDKRSVKEIAEENGVSPKTIWAYVAKHKVEISKDIESRRAKYRTGMRTRAWKALEERLAKDTKAVELVFKLLGDLVERTETKYSDMSPLDKKERIKALLKEISEKKGFANSIDAPKPEDNAI